MKPKFALRHFLALAGSSLLAMSFASAQTTYTWTQTGTGNQDWTTAGNWDVNGVFSSGAVNELRFYADITTAFSAAGSQTITGVPSLLSMNTLTLNGRGPNNTAGFLITIGDSNSTWTIGNATTSTVNLNSALGGGTSDRDVRYTIGANLALNRTITTFTGNSASVTGAVFSGNITETAAGYGITKSGSSLLIFSGNNSYTGTTSVTGGTLRLSSATALSGGTGTTGGTSALTINAGVVELGATDFSRGLGTGSSQFQITGGISGFSARDGQRVVTVNGDASQELQWGSAHFAPTTLILNAATANNSIELANRIDLNAATRTVQVNADKALISNDIRTTSGTAGLTKTGGATLVLTGNNTYDGNTTLTAGALSVETAGNLGAGSSNLVLNGGTLQIRGTTLTSLTGLGRTVSLTNNVNVGFDIHNAANTFTVDQVLNNNNGTRTLTKSGVGTLVLNQNNTFTGGTGASGGGKLVLDYTTNNGSKLSDTAGLTLSGTALVLKGGVGAGANHAEVVNGTTLTTFTSNSISREGGSSTISLGALSLGANSSLGISEANLATTTSSNVNGILPLGRVTVGSHFGSNDGSGNIVAYSGYTAATTAGGGSASVVNQLTGGGTMAATLSSYALRIANDANSNILDLDNKNLSLSNAANNSTLLYAGGFDNNYTINGTGFITQSSGNQTFVINTYAGTTLTVNARLGANGAPISKAGEGTLVVGADNTGNNMSTVHVQQGALRVVNSNGLGTTAAGTNVQGGAALELANNISIGAEALSLNGAGISQGGALRNHSGDNTFGGLITIGASGARINADASSTLTLTGGITTTLTQDVTFGGAGDPTVSTTAITGSGSVIKDGVGTLTLSAANTYTGATNISNGTLAVTGTGSINATSGITIASGAQFKYNSSTALTATITNNGGTISGTGTIGVDLGLNSTAAVISPGNSPGIQPYAVSQTWSSFTYEWETNNFTGITAGTDFDQIAITGDLSLTGVAAGSYILDLISLTGGNVAGNVPNFSEIDRTWNILTTTGEITGFNASYWTIDTTGLTSFTSNPAWTGSWGLGINGTNDALVLSYTAIPEPGAALLGGLGFLLLLRRRR